MKIFRGHMGLGDHIICNALVRHLAKKDTIIVPVKKHNETSVKFMFSDNENIVVMPFKGDRQADKFCRKKAKKGIERSVIKTCRISSLLPGCRPCRPVTSCSESGCPGRGRRPRQMLSSVSRDVTGVVVTLYNCHGSRIA